MTEIITGAERAQPDTAEPLLTLSQLQQLLREATAYERAKRPIILHAATEAAPAGHPGITVTVPTGPAAEDTPERRYSIHELVGHCGMAVAGSGFLTAVVLAVCGSPDVPAAATAGVVGLAVSFGAAVTGTRADDEAQAADWDAWKAAGR
jgi:hypothetical protein